MQHDTKSIYEESMYMFWDKVNDMYFDNGLETRDRKAFLLEIRELLVKDYNTETNKELINNN